jgi:hypothetical protein
VNAGNGIQGPEKGCSPFRQPWGGIEQTLISALINLDDGVVLDPGSERTLGVVGPCLLVSGLRLADTHLLAAAS